MEEIKVNSWVEFVGQIDLLRNKYPNNKLLFRGQANASWPLSTTLERATNKPFDVLSYLNSVSRCSNEIESFTGGRWNVPSYPELAKLINANLDALRVDLPCYDYLVYLRHHGFPSPLLDWSASPYISAYFAYIDSSNTDPAVYCYIEYPNRSKLLSGGSPTIRLFGSYVTTHKRHFAQKACYTVSTQFDVTRQQHVFCPHERVFEKNNHEQDLLFKIILPISERANALTQLNDYNINHFTLFQSEDALIKALAVKEFDLPSL